MARHKVWSDRVVSTALALALVTTVLCGQTVRTSDAAARTDPIGALMRRDSVFVLASAGGDRDLSPVAEIARMRTGSWLAASHDRRSLLVYDKNGRYTRTVGRAGGGPGEFDAAINQILADPLDTVFVVDASGTVNVFSPNFRPVRRFRIPARVIAIAWARPGQFVVNAHIRTPDRVGLTLHFVSTDGTIDRSFGSAGETVLPGQVDVARSIVTSTDGVIWVGRRGTATVQAEQWDRYAVQRRRVELRPRGTIPGGELLQLDARGLLWVGRTISTQKPLTARLDPRSGASWVRRPLSRQDEVVESIHQLIDVFDVETGDIVARDSTASWTRFVRGTDLTYSPRFDEDGVARIVISRIHIQPTPGGRQ